MDEAGAVVAGVEVLVLPVEHGGDQDDAVEHHAVAVRELIGEARRAGGAVALAGHELGGGPALVAGDPEADEVGDRLDVLLDAVELLAVLPGGGAAEAGAHRVDEHEVTGIEDGIFVIDQPARRRQGEPLVGPRHPLGAERAEVYPERRRPGSAVEAEGDRAAGRVLHAVERVGDVEDRRRDRALVVPEQQGAGGGGVGVGLAVQGQRVAGDRRLLFGGEWRFSSGFASFMGAPGGCARAGRASRSSSDEIASEIFLSMAARILPRRPGWS